jgi:opacity protein-like surface antigen
MRRFFFLFCVMSLCAAGRTFAQDTPDLSGERGRVQLGVRSTVSAFSDDGSTGMGAGGQMRIKFGSRLNSDWFADYITTDIAGIAKRTDYHIGWSVLCYPLSNVTRKGHVTPYILAGHCFDWTDVKKNGNIYSYYSVPQKRFSSAVQAGLGAHYNLSDNVDLSLTAQYMMHLGKDIHTTVFDNEYTGEKDIRIEQANLGLEGHLLINMSLNVFIFDMIRNKNKS